ncbi:MAG: hypothetical protein KDB27_35375 [Planctomycetales bacterium]|nr:hypothetical protein [Planctomycetales bacterium]
MDNSSPKVKGLPTRIDRYPAKMISHLAETLVEKYAKEADHLLDPFCGSGAVLRAGSTRGIRVTGIDVNPFGVLLSRVKVEGFDVERANSLYTKLIDVANDCDHLDIEWDKKDYWFTPATLSRFERLRFAASELNLHRSKAGRAILLAFGLAVRPCSRADQRSPKPFISKYARDKRSGKHFNPAKTTEALLKELSELYGGRRLTSGTVYHNDLTSINELRDESLTCSHVITSPPYVNAQDYFRNSKLELFILEGVLPFRIEDIIHRFIGTERGVDRSLLDDDGAKRRRKLVPDLTFLERGHVGQAVILHQYLRDIEAALTAIKEMLEPNGTLVLVCGDNLIGGRRIVTWQVLNRMLQNLGFMMFDTFGDRIRNRAVAPRRSGHKGMIKEEIVSAFRVQ